MSRRLQISNNIKEVKDEIQDIDCYIQKEYQKQNILDDLLRQLDLSNQQESQSQSQIQSSSSRKGQCSQRHNINHDGISERSRSDLENYSIITQDLSFQIQKIKVFQKGNYFLNQNNNQHENEIYIQKDNFVKKNKKYQQNIPIVQNLQQPNSNQLKLNKLDLYKQFQVKQIYKRNQLSKCQNQIKYSSQYSQKLKNVNLNLKIQQKNVKTKIDQIELENQLQRKREQFSVIIEEKERKRSQSLAQQKKGIRQQLITQRRKNSQKQKVHQFQNEKLQNEYNYEKIQRQIKQKLTLSKNLIIQIHKKQEGMQNKLYDESQIWNNQLSKTIRNKYNFQVVNNLNQTMIGCSHSKLFSNYSRYINKTIASLSKTQQKLSYLKASLPKHPKNSNFYLNN